MVNVPPYTKAVKTKPEDSHVFKTSDGDKIRIRFDAIQIYRSEGRNSVVEIGWGDKASYILDVGFDELDKMILDNKKAWDDYWKAEYSSWD